MKESVAPPKVNVAVLWGELPTYLTACLEALQNRYQIDLLVVRTSTNSQSPSERHPYEEKVFTGLQKNIMWEELGSTQAQRLKSLQTFLDGFQPQVLLIGNWAHSRYGSLVITSTQARCGGDWLHG